MKLRPLLLSLILAGAPVAVVAAGDEALMAVFERAELGRFDLDLGSDLGPFEPPARDLIEGLYALARLDTRKAESALRRYAARQDRDLARQREFYSLSEDLYLQQGRYAKAAKAGAALLKLPDADKQEDYQSSLQSAGVAQMLQDVPPVRVIDGVKADDIPSSRDRAGLTRIPIRINGHMQEAVVDTGASFSVLSAATAQKLGLLTLRGTAKLGSSVAPEISSRLTVAKDVYVGTTHFTSVVLLVLDDEQLTFPIPGGYSIPAILGFPELQRLGRFRFDDAALHVGAAPAARSRNMVMAGSKVYVETDVAGECVPLLLDTGANASALTSLYAEQHPALVGTLRSRPRRLGGAGGVTTEDVLNWEGVTFEVGDRQIFLPQLDVSQSKEAVRPPQYGTLGRDVLAKGYGMDFDGMQLWIEGDPAAAPNACLKAHTSRS